MSVDKPGDARPPPPHAPHPIAYTSAGGANSSTGPPGGSIPPHRPLCTLFRPACAGAHLGADSC